MDINKAGLSGINRTGFKGEINEEQKPDYKPEGRLLAEREMTNLINVDNYISSFRSLSNDGLLNNPRFNFYIKEDFSKTIIDRYGHRRPAVSTLEVVNQKTKQPRLIARYIGEKLVLKAEYDQQGNMFKKTEFYGNNGNGMVYHFGENGKCIKQESLK